MGGGRGGNQLPREAARRGRKPVRTGGTGGLTSDRTEVSLADLGVREWPEAGE